MKKTFKLFAILLAFVMLLSGCSDGGSGSSSSSGGGGSSKKSSDKTQTAQTGTAVSGGEQCDWCNGSGLCINCMGTGYYETTSMGEIVQMDCNACNKGVCSYCYGKKKVRCMCKSYDLN